MKSVVLMKKILSALLFLVILGSCAGGAKNSLDKILAVEFGTPTDQALQIFKKQGFTPLNLSTEESLEQPTMSRYSSMFQKKPDLFSIHAFSGKIGSSTPSQIFAIFYADQFYTLHIVQSPVDMVAYGNLMSKAVERFGEAELGSNETLSFWHLNESLDRFLVLTVQEENFMIVALDEAILLAVDNALFAALPIINEWPFAAGLNMSATEVITKEEQAPFERFSSGEDEMISFLANFNGDRLLYSYLFFPNANNEVSSRVLSITSFEGDLTTLEVMLTNHLGNPTRVRRNVVNEAYGTDVSATITEWSTPAGHSAKMLTISYPAPHSHAPGEVHSDDEAPMMQSETYFIYTDDAENLALLDF